jgi:hypothetical protein
MVRLLAVCLASSAVCVFARGEEGNTRFAVILETGIRADAGSIGAVPSRMSKTLLSEGLATTADLEGAPFANGAVLFMPSILGRRPDKWALYTPPALREQVRKGVFVRVIESAWMGLGVARTRIIRGVLTREQYPEVYDQCTDALEVHVCVDRIMKKRPSRTEEVAPAPEPSASGNNASAQL